MNSKGHLYISLVKSVMRIVAAIAFCCGNIVLGGSFLGGAELLGIAEELVDKR